MILLTLSKFVLEESIITISKEQNKLFLYKFQEGSLKSKNIN